ncbi:MAG: zinc-binding dehydrogenase [Gammaproteobacteria bacterium]|nr:zinc-binding dehydrogenase [Gammaproteobacteria bacterium]
MRAALMERGRIWVEDVPDPTPAEGEVVVKSVACGICGSDLHAARHTEEFVATSIEAGGAFKLTTFDPVVLGHEFCAEVMETRGDIRAGDLVCSVPALARPVTVGVGYSPEAPGGFGEYMLLSERLLMPVPAGTPQDHAALTEPMAVGYHAVNMARLEGDEGIVVIGAGPVGLAVTANLKARGAGPVAVAEFSARRRELAVALGADIVVDPRERTPYGLAEIAGRDQTVIFECVGVPGMIDEIFLNAPQRARIVVVGVCLQMDRSRPLIAVNKELNVQYVLGYTVPEFHETLHHIADGKLDVGPIVTHTVDLDGVAGAFDDLARPDAHGKVVVRPWD